MTMLFHGSKLEHTVDGGENYTLVTGVTGFSDPGSSRAEIDITHSQSLAKEYLVDLPDNGTMTFDLLLIAADPGQMAVRTQSKTGLANGYRITFVDATELDFNAYVSSISRTGSEGSAVTGSLSLRVTGEVSGTAV